jgi:hypothetical protein
MDNSDLQDLGISLISQLEEPTFNSYRNGLLGKIATSVTRILPCFEQLEIGLRACETEPYDDMIEFEIELHSLLNIAWGCGRHLRSWQTVQKSICLDVLENGINAPADRSIVEIQHSKVMVSFEQFLEAAKSLERESIYRIKQLKENGPSSSCSYVLK